MSRIFITLVGIDPEQDITKTAVALVRHGYAVVPVKVGGKQPICTLTAREIKAQGVDHDCGVAHAITSEKDARRIFSRLGKNGDRYNLGVVAGPSHLVIVDADTAEQVEAFVSDWATGENDESMRLHTPTVRTPGMRDDAGGWAHKDGGHFYFEVPDGVTLPFDLKHTMKAPGGYDVKWGMSMVVAPPSVRPEGRYVPTGDIIPAPQFLLDMIQRHITEVTERRLARASLTANDDVAAWATSVTWEELLSPVGWTDTGKLDKCGCPIWTKPGGGRTSYKSATAHDTDCTQYDNIEGHGPLHLWTTEPPAELESLVMAGTQTITKLQFVAAMEYDGDVQAAMAGLGIGDVGEGVAAWLNDFESKPVDESQPVVEDEVPCQAPSPVSPTPAGFTWDSSGDSPSPSNPEPRVPKDQGLGIQESRGNTDKDVQKAVSFWMEHELDDDEFRRKVAERAKQEAINRRAREYLDFKMGGSAGAVVSYGIDLDESEVVAPTLGRREDDSPLLYRSRVNTVFGPSESGKSWLTLFFVKQVLDDGGKVLVIDLEDDKAGFAHRLKTIGLDPAHTARLGYLTGLLELGESIRLQIINASRGTDLVIVDSMDALLAIMGHDTNGAAGVRLAGSFLKKIAVDCGTAVLVVDHSTEKLQAGERANTQMGSSAKKQFIDGATLRADRLTVWAPNTECKTLITIGKDRHGWAKAHALFDGESPWGRAAMLTMRPGWPDHTGSELRLESPPSFDEMPDATGSEQREAEDAIIDFLRSNAGQWKSRTAVFRAAGDKNGRKGISHAADALVAQGVIESRTVAIRGGKDGTEYRYTPLDHANPESHA